MSGRLKLENLLTLKVCEEFGGLDADEASVRRAMERAEWVGPESASSVAAMLTLARLASTSILFAIDRDTLAAAVGSASGPPPELPPLPFKKIIFEADQDQVWLLKVDGRPDKQIEVVWLSEIHEGEEWAAVVFATDPTKNIFGVEGAHPFELHYLTIQPDRLVELHPDTTTEDTTDYAIWRFLVDAMHYITARGVSHVELTPARPMRRRADRLGYALPPRIYSVEIMDTVLNLTSGTTEREYRYRWPVRGHWRRLSSGSRTWVRPYIKGKPGAPWRGRPVYHVAAGRKQAA